MRSEQSDLERRLVVDWVEPQARVLELGCGNGDLLALLITEKGVQAQGIETDHELVYRCVRRGLKVLQEPPDEALRDYADTSFDYAIFAGSLQRVVRQPDIVLNEALRISRKVIVGFSNFAHFQARWQIFFEGKTPITPSLPYEWHDTPNLHFLSIADFTDYCRARNVRIERAAFLGRHSLIRVFPNLRAQTGWFLISRGNGK